MRNNRSKSYGRLYFVKKPKVRYNFSLYIKFIQVRAIIFFSKIINLKNVLKFNLDIILEEKASSTVKNFLFSFDIIKEFQASRIIIVTSEHHGPRAKFVCRAVMSHRHLSYKLEISTSKDQFPGVEELINHEMKMMSWFIPYLKKYGIESPGEEYFEEAKSQLKIQCENLKT